MPSPGSGVSGERNIWPTRSGGFALRMKGQYIGTFSTLKAAIARRDSVTAKICPTCGCRTLYHD